MVDEVISSLSSFEMWNATTNGSCTNSSRVPTNSFRFWIEPDWFTILRLFFTSAIALLGVMGNFAVCYVVTKRPDMWTGVNFYIRNLSLTDLGVLLVNFPLAVVKDRFKGRFSGPLGEFVCRAIQPGIDVVFSVAVWTIACIAIERYIAVARNTARYQTSLTAARATIFSLWILSFLICGLPLYLVTDYSERSRCFLDWPDSAPRGSVKAYLGVVLVATYILPLAVVLWTYFKIARTVSSSSDFYSHMLRQFSGGHGQAQRLIEQRLKQNYRVKRLLTPVVLVFALTLLPINLLKVIQLVEGGFYTFEYIHLIFNLSSLLVVINASADPLIYCLVSGNFRNAFKSLISRGRYKVRMPSGLDHTHKSPPDGNTQLKMTNITNLSSSKSSRDSRNSTYL